MSYTATKLIAIAEAELGYHEKATNSNLDSKTANSGSNNYTKYGRDLNNAGYYNFNKNGYAWCDQFVDWCFLKLCGSKSKAEDLECQTGVYGAGCGYSMSYYDKQGRFSKTPKVGDQVFFRYKGTTSGADHTGIVVAVTDTQVTTIEGNAGNRVQKKVYSRNDPTLYGYGHPKYDAEPAAPTPAPQPICRVDMEQMSRGSKGPQVCTMQRILKQLGYKDANGKTLVVDGRWGPATDYALKAYQKKRFGSADGICGIKTWTKLLKEEKA